MGGDVHTSAVLAADSVPRHVVERFLTAAAASFERQRHDPGRGVAGLRARYPDVDPEVAVDTWRRLEPSAFAADGGSVGGMDAEGWERTLRWYARTRDLPPAASTGWPAPISWPSGARR